MGTLNQVIQELSDGKIRVYEVVDSSTESADAGGYTTITINGKYKDMEV